MTGESVFEPVLEVLPENLRVILKKLPASMKGSIEEIRLRQERPLSVGFTGGEKYITSAGGPSADPHNAYIVTGEDMQRALRLVSNSSLYALEEEMKNGYITITGGYRVGITGKAVLENGRVKTVKYISGLNIRICREVKGAADGVIPFIIDRHHRVYHTLILSPPRCGKTTLLRDIVRMLSSGVPKIKFPGVAVGLVDERSELAGCYRGVPRRDVGWRTDVLDSCPKSEGMIMLLRAMGPQVLATDEIGKQEDIKALEEVINAGTAIITTVHGASLDEIVKRPALKYLLGLKVIERYIILGRSQGTGTVEDIIDGNSGRSLGVRKCSSLQARL